MYPKTLLNQKSELDKSEKQLDNANINIKKIKMIGASALEQVKAHRI